MQKPHVKHNPAFLSDDELSAAFVVRYDDLQLVVRIVRENMNDSNQHVLVIGPRGIGKTMLVRRVALEILKDEDLRNKWFPLIFAEESYEVGSTGEFWLEALFHLARQTGDANWVSTYNELKREPVEDRLCERALAQLMDFADKQGKRLLLIVENLNMILTNQIDDNHQWKLRRTLMHEPRIMLLATATTRIDLPENINKPFYELFKSHVLQPLKDEECQLVWRSIAGQELGPKRIRAISILTGGNPRLLAIISQFGASLSFTELIQNMTSLVDDHTDYFKSHLDALPHTERKVYVALADLWDPSTAREVADASRLQVSLTSSLLKRLIGRGAVTEGLTKGRTKRYQVAERMYNIYYLMRRRGAPSERVKAIVQFMIQFYENTELIEVARRLSEEACHLSCEERQYHCHAYEGILRNAPAKLTSKILQYTPRDFLEASDQPESLQQWLVDAGIGRICPCSVFRKAETAVMDIMLEGFKAARKENRQEAENHFRKAIEIDSSYPDAWIALGRILDEIGGCDAEAEQSFRKAIEMAPYDPCLWNILGIFLQKQSGRCEESEQAFQRAIELYSDCSEAWHGLAKIAEVQPGKEQQVIKAYNEAEDACIRQTQKYPEHEPSWRMLGAIRHYHTHRYTEAETAYRKSIELNPKSSRNWRNLGKLLYRMERYKEAEKAFRKVLELNGRNKEVLGDLALTLLCLKKYDEAEGLLKEIIEHVPKQIKMAWRNLGRLYEQKEMYIEAEVAYRKVIENIDPNDDWAWYHLALLLQKHLQRYSEAEAAYIKAAELNPKHFCPRIQLVELALIQLQPDRALELAKQSLISFPDRAHVFNELAWAFFSIGPTRLLNQAADWAEKAVELESTPEYIHTQACLLARAGKSPEALRAASRLLEDSEFVGYHIDDMVTLFSELLKAGQSLQAFTILSDSKSAAALEPVAIALQMYLGRDVHVAPEIAEVAKDVLKRFKNENRE
jgi:tetratricopeptide (TPR) repeat protein